MGGPTSGGPGVAPPGKYSPDLPLRYDPGAGVNTEVRDQGVECGGLGYSRIMSERDDRYVGNDIPRTTGEFRATPDASASTAEFRAFAAGSVGGQVTDSGSWPEQPWAGDPPAPGSKRMLGVVIGVVVAIIVIGLAVALFA